MELAADHAHFSLDTHLKFSVLAGEKSVIVSKVTFKLEKVFASMNKMALVKFKLNQPNSTIENEKIQIKAQKIGESLSGRCIKSVICKHKNDTKIAFISKI